MTEKTIEQHRQEFEDWFIKTNAYWDGAFAKRSDGDYWYGQTHALWSGFKAGRGIKE